MMYYRITFYKYLEGERMLIEAECNIPNIIEAIEACLVHHDITQDQIINVKCMQYDEEEK